MELYTEDSVRKGVDDANKSLISIMDRAVEEVKALLAENPSLLEGQSDELRKRWRLDS